MRRRRAVLVAAGAMALLAGACGAGPTDQQGGLRRAGTAGVELVVHRSSTCPCCGGWQESMRDAGMVIKEEHHDDMAWVKDSYGVPMDQRSCHTTEVGGYFVEGHVPAAAIADLLQATPDVEGIALAGMPSGSPGMPGEQDGPLVVTTIVDGEVTGELGRY